MVSMDEQMKDVGSGDRAVLMDEMKMMGEGQGKPAAKKVINSELWHACAGPLVSIPQPGSLVYYFPQGHSEQVTASTKKTAYSHIPNYPNLPSQLMCQVHNVTLHAEKDTDEIYAQMTLQPVNSELDVFPIPDFGHTRSKQPTDFFCKNLTASDTSTHGGFSVPRRAAEKLFPQLDYSMQPPNQELIVRDLHDNVWTFRHIYRGQPKRHLLTTGWSLFVGTKRLKAGDAVLFIRDEKSQLLLGIRRASRQQTALPSCVLSADSMHMGVLAAAAHAAASLSPFIVYYNPRSCSSEFVVPLGKYHKAAYAQISIGMRFGMMFETEESTKRRYMGTIAGISDYDPLRWPNSKWRNLQVEWDEHGYGERPERVSLWEIETPESLFIFPTQTPSLKRQCLPGFVVPGTGVRFGNMKTLLQSPENGQNFLHPVISDLGPEQLMKVLFRPQTPNHDSQLGFHPSIYASILHNARRNDTSTYCSSNLPTLPTTRNPQEGILTKMVMQQKHNFPHVQQQMLSLHNNVLQNQIHQHCVDQGGIDYASWDQIKPPKQMDTHAEHHEQNDCSEGRVNLSGNRYQDALLQASASEKSDVASVSERNQLDEHLEEKMEATNQQHSECSYQRLLEHSRESSVQLSDHETFITPYSASEEPKKRKQDDSELLQQQLFVPSTTALPWLDTVPQVDKDDVDSLVAHQGYQLSQYLDDDNWSLHSSYNQSFTGYLKSPEYLSSSVKAEPILLSARENTASSSADISSIVNPVETLQFSCISDSQSPQCLPNFIQEFFGAQELNPLNELVAPGILPFQVNDSQVQKEGSSLQVFSNSFGARDMSDDSNNQCESYSSLHLETSKRSRIDGSSASSTVLETLGTVKGSGFYVPSDDLVGKFTSNQDLQSQVTAASLMANSQAFSLQEIPDSSGGTSSSSVEVNEHGLAMGPLTQVSQQPLRTYTKVQKLGSVGRSIDVTRFRNYQELTSAIACMFGLEGQLDDRRTSEWKLVYVDYENDVLLVGDDPWEEFVNCVRCIRILSPSEVQLMSEDGMQLMNNYIPPCQ